MPVVMRGCYFFVQPGQKRFEVSSNFTNYLELGTPGKTRYYLEARIDGDEFKISGIMLDESDNELCRLKDNFITTSKGCQKEMTQVGYRVRDSKGNLIIEIGVDRDMICHLKGVIYGDKGEIIAQSRNGEFVVLKGPAIIGKAGNAIGIRLE